VRTEGFSYREIARDGAARAGQFKTPRALVETPVFMPVGTLATVKSQSPDEVAATGAKLILANTYHLWLRPGPEIVDELGGVQRFMGWPHALLTDSGGFQVFSLADLRTIDDDGVSFKSHLDGRALRLTPEESMRIQVLLGSDIAMAFDECPPGGGERVVIERAMRRTSAWARRCLLAPWREGQARFGIVQGATHVDLRLSHLDEIAGMEAGGREFDGIALGGFSVGEPIPEMWAALSEVVPRMPVDRPRYLMGVGTPYDLLHAMGCGIDLFDCVMPTRNARNGQALTWSGRVNLKQARHKRDESALDRDCDCPVCTRYSRAYLHHLVRTGEMLGARLLTEHNLWFYGALTRRGREQIGAGGYHAWAKQAESKMREGDEVGQGQAEKPTFPKAAAITVSEETTRRKVEMNMEAMQLLRNRHSVSKLVPPAPEGDALARILEVALRAPDHGALRPWKILLVRGDARAHLGELLADVLRHRRPDATEEELSREKGKAMRAPLIAIVVASLRPSAKIPEIEQLLSAGCVAYGLEIAAQAEGFGAVWKTGDAAYDRMLHEGLGLGESDRIVGLIYLGTPREEPPMTARPEVASHVVEWTGVSKRG
jgi:queuine tRNA-ribosyltransferase